MDRYIYMVVTQDEYELPLIVSENILDIARFTGKSVKSIRSSLAHFYNGEYKTSQYRRVKKDE